MVVFSFTAICSVRAGNKLNVIPSSTEAGIDKTVINRELQSYNHQSILRGECYYSDLPFHGLPHYLNADTLFNKRVDAIVKERNVERKELLYQDLLKEFPENSGSRKDGYIKVRTSLALFWSTKGNAQKVRTYYNLIKGQVTTAHPLGFAINLVKHKEMEEAVKILYGIRQQVKDEASANAGKLYIFLRAYATLAEALHYLQKDEEALTYIEQAYQKSYKKRESINTVYAAILNKLNKHAMALPLMEDLVSSGMASAKIKALFKESYLAVYNSSAGFTKLMDSLNGRLQYNMSRIADTGMLAIPAFDFTLMDLNGQTVSLSSLRGKIVVLDFWATWCIPCIKSLPAMQKARDHFSSDKDIVFLFINTGEAMPDRAEKVKEFMKQKGYNLHVLLDQKNDKRSGFIAATGFKVKGIPTKFIVDNNGTIRYRMVGFNGGDDATVAELIAMINSIKDKRN